MKDVYFRMLDIRAAIQDKYEFQDLGYVPNLLTKTRELFARIRRPNEERDIEQQGIDVVHLRANSGGLFLEVEDYPAHGSVSLWIFYNRFSDVATNFSNRAHEEAHAACTLGLRGELEQRIGTPQLSSLNEEDFCDQAGLYALRLREITPHPNLLLPYAERVARVKKIIASRIAART